MGVMAFGMGIGFHEAGEYLHVSADLAWQLGPPGPELVMVEVSRGWARALWRMKFCQNSDA